MKALILTMLVLTTSHAALADSMYSQDSSMNAQQMGQMMPQPAVANCHYVDKVAPDDDSNACAPDHAWGLGGNGGFLCCTHPPT